MSSLSAAPKHPEVQYLRQVVTVFEFERCCYVTAEVSSTMDHLVQSVTQNYPWTEFKTMNFERDPKYEAEFDKAQRLVEELQPSNWGWAGVCAWFRGLRLFVCYSL